MAKPRAYKRGKSGEKRAEKRAEIVTEITNTSVSGNGFSNHKLVVQTVRYTGADWR